MNLVLEKVRSMGDSPDRTQCNLPCSESSEQYQERQLPGMKQHEDLIINLEIPAVVHEPVIHIWMISEHVISEIKQMIRINQPTGDQGNGHA